MLSLAVLTSTCVLIVVQRLALFVDRKFAIAIVGFYALLFVFYALAITIQGAAPIARGDSMFYHLGGVSTYNSVTAGVPVVDALFGYTWSEKYWAYIVVNSFSVAIFPDSVFQQAVYVKVFNCCMWLLIIFHAAKNGLLDAVSYSKYRFFGYNPYIVSFLLLASIFPTFLIYRDSLIAALLYFVIYYVYVNKSVIVIIPLVLLYFTRTELLSALLAGVVVSAILSVTVKRKYGWALFICLVVSVFLVMLIGHYRFEISRMIKIPLGLVGTSPFQLIAQAVDGSSYYDDNVFTKLSHIMFAMAWVYFVYLFLKPISDTAKVSGEHLNLYYFSSFLVLFNLVAYTLINDGFQERVRAGLIPCIIFISFVFRRSKFSNVTFAITFALLILVSLRNVRWIF